MTCATWLHAATRRLTEAGISTARLDCLVLLEDILNTYRTQILAEPTRELTEVELRRLESLVTKRAQHTPLAYLRNTTEFYGREFYVDAHVLVPRPESEAFIDILKSLRLGDGAKVTDVGSGSGALGITAKLELPDLDVTLIEIDAGALAVSQRNAKHHSVFVRTAQKDLLKNQSEHYDVLLCNLPYVPDSFSINRAASYEPKLALFGGPDGLAIYRQLFAHIDKLDQRPMYILAESMPTQHTALQQLAGASGYRLRQTEGYVQLFHRI